MKRAVCLRCQARIALGSDYCPRCGVAVGHLARHFVGSYRFAAIGGRRRKPGELSTFARLKWLPFAFAVVMLLLTLAAIPGTAGVVSAPVVALVALATCSVLQSRMVTAAEREKDERKD